LQKFDQTVLTYYAGNDYVLMQITFNMAENEWPKIRNIHNTHS